MNPKALYLSLAALSILINSCKKNEDSTPPPAPSITIYPDYSQLKVGNYWIYQQFDVDSSGNATPTNNYDSCYVEKDTTINSHIYYKVFRPSIVANYNYSFIRDSLHCTVSASGDIVFSSKDFTTVFSSYYGFAGSDTIYHVTKKMSDQNAPIVTPAGTYVTSNFKVTYSMYPAWSFAGNLRYMHTRYAENIGIVVETLPFFSSNPNYVERRLVRYHLN